MNILTLCERGNNRSVIMASILRENGHQRDVISQGVYTATQDTLVMLYDWADKIILTTTTISGSIHPEYENKVMVCDMGPDPYGPNYHPGFRNKALSFIEENDLCV